MSYLTFLKSENKSIYLLFSILPISIIAGSAILNFVIIFIDLYFIIAIIKKKEAKFLINKIFIIFILVWLLLLLNSIFVANTFESLTRSFGFIRFILLIFAFKYFFEKKTEYFTKYVFGFWSLVFLVVTIDIYFEFYMGFNLLGFKSDYNGRIASFTGDELKIGNFYFGFILLALSFFYINFDKSNKLYFYIIALLFLIASFIIGERSNFLKIFLIFTLFIFLINRKDYIKKSFTILSFIILTILIIDGNNFFKSRFIVEILKPIKEKGINKFINETQYGLHFELAKNIYSENKIFGVGIKNFRNESKKIQYHSDRTFKHGVTTHPHQIHYEFLSETGTIGYLIFITFFLYSIIYGSLSFFKNYNPYVLSSTLFLLATFIPLIPSGSFFTSYGATIFWINFCFLVIKKY